MKVAIIGGIGSGKSSVLSLLSSYGERVCDCDEIYKQICQLPTYIAQIDKIFSVVRDGKIDKSALAQIVFSDKEKLKTLNNLAHPQVFAEIEKIYKESDTNLFIEVSAFDKVMKDFFDEIIFVRSDKSARVERVKKRDGRNDDDILAIMAGQLSEEEMENVADFVIVNDKDIKSLESQVEWILQWLG